LETINYTYHGNEELKAFVTENAISDNPRLLIQVFSGVCSYSELDEIRQVFNAIFPTSCLMGTTTDGAIFDAEVAIEQDVVVAFTQFKKTDLSFTHCYSDQKDSLLLGQEIAQTIYDAKKTKVIISFTDGIHVNGEEYLKGIDSICSHIPVAGGMAGDNGELVKTYIFSNQCVSGNGAIAVALNGEKLQVNTSYSFNWTPIGKRMIVTRSYKNQVFEIDGLSAVEVYSKYMGKELANQLPQVGIEFPLIIQTEDMLIGRAALEKGDDGSLKFAGNIPEQTEVRFGVGNLEMILHDSKLHANYLNDNVESIFVYSCMARRRFLHGSVVTEFDSLNRVSTVSGFFTYGEFYSDENNKKFLLNESMTIIALSEGIEHKLEQPIEIDNDNDFDTKTNSLLALSHLVNVVSEELETLNTHLEDRVDDNTAYILRQIFTDPLTQIPNRAKLIKDIEDNKENYIVLINIDQFSMINDFYGFQAGDEVLKQLSQAISAVMVHGVQCLYRLSSDEFAILFPYDYSQEKITTIITTCLSRLEPLVFKYENEDIAVSITIAAAKDNKDKSSLLAHLNMALRYARKNKLNFAIYSDALLLTPEYKTNIAMVKKVRIAVQNNKIIPFYQPIIDLSSEKIVKYECLARLIDEDGSIILPYEFLPIANKIRLYDEVTRLMVTHAFKRFSGTEMAFTINLSMDDIYDSKTQKIIFDLIDQYQVASQVTFEILETQELKNDDTIVDFIEKIQGMNGEIAIDDFGSGFSNFERMTRIHANVIKIDGSLIKNIHKDPNARIVVETIINFANKLGMQVVAEFVHSRAVLGEVKTLGVTHAQGYFFGKPEPDLIED